jgi:ABC-type sugar transport system permease subunit
MKKKDILISFSQALGLAAYISLVSLIFWKGNEWFGPASNFFGPMLVLTLLVASALICGGIAFGYPLYLALEKKRIKEAIKVVVYTTTWVILFFAVVALIRFS